MSLLLLFDSQRRPVTPVLEKVEQPRSYKEPSVPLFYSDQETEVLRQITNEYYEVMYPRIPIIMIDRDRTFVDPLLLEAEDKCWKEDPIYVPGHVQWDPETFFLARFGIEIEQELVVIFPEELLSDAVGSKDLERYLPGSVMVIDPDRDGRHAYLIHSVHRRPEDVVNAFGDVLVVMITADVYYRSSLEEQHKFPLEFPMLAFQAPDGPHLTELESPLFYGDEEMELFQQMVAEGYSVVYPSVAINLIDREKTHRDTLLSEAEFPVFKDPIHVPAHVTWSPATHELRKFGIDEDQEVLVVFSDYMLKEATGLSDLREMVGSVIILNVDRSGRLRKYLVHSIHKQPQDAISTRGHVTNVALTVTVYPETPDGNDDLFDPSSFEDPDADHGIR